MLYTVAAQVVRRALLSAQECLGMAVCRFALLLDIKLLILMVKKA